MGPSCNFVPVSTLSVFVPLMDALALTTYNLMEHTMRLRLYNISGCFFTTPERYSGRSRWQFETDVACLSRCTAYAQPT